MIEDMEAALADPDLDWRQRSRYNRDIAMLLHQVASLPVPAYTAAEIRTVRHREAT
jgi:hypothetical protein